MPRRSGSAQLKTAGPSPDSSWLPHEAQQHDAGAQQRDTQGCEKGVGRPGSWSAKDFVHLPTGRQLRRHRNGARSAAGVYNHFLDRNQGGKACDQPITNGMGNYCRANLRLSVLICLPPAVDQILDALPGPEGCDARMESRPRRVKIDGRLIGVIARVSCQVSLPHAAFRNASEDQQWLPLEKVRQTLRVLLRHLHTLKGQFHIGQYWTLDALEKLRHLRSSLIDVRDVREGPSSELGHLGGEEEIRRAPDGHRVQARAAQIMPQRGENLLLIAEIAVSQKDNVAQVAGNLRLAHQVKQRWQHLGAAAGLETMHIIAGPFEIFRCTGKGGGL